MKTYNALAAGLTAGAFTLVSCTPTQQKYGAGGAVVGGVGAAILGGDSTDVGRAAAIGGAGGAAYGAYKENQDGQATPPNIGSYIAPAPVPAPVPAPKNYPAAHPTETPGIVISPHKPYNKVSVKGLKPGQLATDPTTNKIFVIPN